jgi:6-phosphofructokinase
LASTITLLPSGGDDTLSYAAKLNELGVRIVGIPKTMDNGVRNTEHCIGFSTAITRATKADARACAGFKRTGVEVLGPAASTCSHETQLKRGGN